MTLLHMILLLAGARQMPHVHDGISETLALPSVNFGYLYLHWSQSTLGFGKDCFAALLCHCLLSLSSSRHDIVDCGAMVASCELE